MPARATRRELAARLSQGSTNGVGDIGRELDYLQHRVGANVQLAAGTEAFNPNKLPLAI